MIQGGLVVVCVDLIKYVGALLVQVADNWTKWLDVGVVLEI